MNALAALLFAIGIASGAMALLLTVIDEFAGRYR